MRREYHTSGYHTKDIEPVRRLTGTTRPIIMARLYNALTDEYLTAKALTLISGISDPRQAGKYLSTLFHLDYAERRREPDKTFSYRRNGRDLIKDEYQVWKTELENLSNKINRIS